MDPITTHVADAVARLLAQYRKPQREALISAMVSEAQAFENALDDVETLRQLANATGEQLDGIGGIVGEPRNGRTDPDYLVAVSTRVLVNRSSGTGPDLIAIFSTLAGGAGCGVQVEDQPPAAFVLRLTKAAAPKPADYAAILHQARDGGVRAILEWLAADPSVSFCFSGGSGLGFGDSSNPATGGAFAGAME